MRTGTTARRGFQGARAGKGGLSVCVRHAGRGTVRAPAWAACAVPGSPRHAALASRAPWPHPAVLHPVSRPRPAGGSEALVPASSSGVAIVGTDPSSWLPGPGAPFSALGLLKWPTMREQTSPRERRAGGPPARRRQPRNGERTGREAPRPHGPGEAPPGHKRREGRRVARRAGGCLRARGGGRGVLCGRGAEGGAGRMARGCAPPDVPAAGGRQEPEPRASLSRVRGADGSPEPARSPAAATPAGRGGRPPVPGPPAGHPDPDPRSGCRMGRPLPRPREVAECNCAESTLEPYQRDRRLL